MTASFRKDHWLLIVKYQTALDKMKEATPTLKKKQL
jgi:hypothetical protein